MSKKGIVISILALVLALAIAVPGVAPVQALSYTLIVNLNTNNNGTAASPGDGLNVYVARVTVNKSDGTYVTKKDGVTGTCSFLLPADNYNVVSVQGPISSVSRTDGIAVVSSDTFLNVPCGKLIVNLNTNNNGTAASPGDGLNVSVDRVTVNKTGGILVTQKDNVLGTWSFALLATADTAFTYDVVSAKWSGPVSRTNTGVTVASGDNVLNVPCGKLIVTAYANNNTNWAASLARVTVNKTGGSVVVYKDNVYNVNGTYSFALLATADTGFTYDVVSVQGPISSVGRTETGVTVASGDNVLDVPVARFRVAVVKGDFLSQSVDRVAVNKTGGILVTKKDNVTGSYEFSLLQSDINGAKLTSTTGTTSINGTGVGAYTFVATKNVTVAQTTASANEIPPAGLGGVILMIP
jgi:hypothetical protein